MPRRSYGSSAKRASAKPDLKNSLRLIFNKNFSIALTLNLIVMIMYFLVVVTGADHVLNRYATSLSIAGLSSGTAVIGCLFGRLLGGYLFSIVGGKKLLLYGLWVFCLSFALILFIPSLGGVFFSRFTAGFGAGMTIAACETIATLSVPHTCTGLGIGIFSYSVVLGLALGPFLGIQLTASVSYMTLMFAMLFVSMPLWLGALFLKDSAAAHKIHRKASDIYAYIDPRVLPLALVIMLVFMGYGCLQIYIMDYASERGLTESASLFFLVYGITAVASRPFTGRMFDAGMLNSIIYPLFAATIAGLLILAWTKSGLPVLVAGVFCGLGYGNLQSIGQAISVGLVTPTRYAQATSTFFNLMNLGIGLGPYMFGYIVAPFGYAGLFILLAATVFIAAILYFFLQVRQAV